MKKSEQTTSYPEHAATDELAWRNSRIEELTSELDELKRELEQVSEELATTRAALELVYQSRTLRAGKIIAAPARALLAVRSGRRRGYRAPRSRDPKTAYGETTANGQPWHFPGAGKRPRRRDPDPLNQLLKLFGDPETPLDGSRASRIVELLKEGAWCGDESLVSRRLSVDERRAVVEAEAVACLALDCVPDSVLELERKDAPAAVIDARSLQAPEYRSRGVGLHARMVLGAVRSALQDLSQVLLTDAELPELHDDLIDGADEIVFNLLPLRARDVRLLLELSPMTAGVQHVLPLLLNPNCFSAAVVYDFIPTRYPAAYLTIPAAALSNRARLETLRYYDLLLPISEATRSEGERILGEGLQWFPTGVADPLEGIETPASDGRRPPPFALIPSGGDARKNTAAAVAAVAAGNATGVQRLHAVVIGTLPITQRRALLDLARAAGMSETEIDLRESVPPEEMAQMYASAAVVIVPSIAEGFSIPIVEAVHRGTPVVASDIAAHRELLGDGPWLASPSDVGDLARVLRHVRERSNEISSTQRERLGDRAQPVTVSGRLETALSSQVIGPRPERLPARRQRDGRPRIAVVSPLPPQQTGVAAYTAYTFAAVARHAKVDFYSASRGDPNSSRPNPLASLPYVSPLVDAVVNVVGNSHFHFPILDLLAAYGGATIAHDNRMLESYLYDRGSAWTAALMSRDGIRVRPDELDELIRNLDQTPSTGYRVIAAESSPLIVHGAALAARIEDETGVAPCVIPFVPYNLPEDGELVPERRLQARRELGLDDGLLHVATFGYVDRRTKGTDLVVGALSWLRLWGRRSHLHIVGGCSPAEQQALVTLSEELNVREALTFHGHVTPNALGEFLLAVDVAIQLRTSALLSLSGALADCIAFGLPVVTSADVAREFDAPSYVATTPPVTSSLLVAEALEHHIAALPDAAQIERERHAYLTDRSVTAYARHLLEALGLS